MTVPTTDPAARVFPLPRAADDDPRFNMGLLIDVCEVLEKHGYQKPTHGLDLVDLQSALFGFLYGETRFGGVRS